MKSNIASLFLEKQPNTHVFARLSCYTVPKLPGFRSKLHEQQSKFAILYRLLPFAHTFTLYRAVQQQKKLFGCVFFKARSTMAKKGQWLRALTACNCRQNKSHRISLFKKGGCTAPQIILLILFLLRYQSCGRSGHKLSALLQFRLLQPEFPSGSIQRKYRLQQLLLRQHQRKS